jgi:hypothetical protein
VKCEVERQIGSHAAACCLEQQIDTDHTRSTPRFKWKLEGMEAMIHTFGLSQSNFLELGPEYVTSECAKYILVPLIMVSASGKI